METVKKEDLIVAESLVSFVENDVLPGIGISVDHFWKALSQIRAEFMPINTALLEKRDDYRERINAWLKEHKKKGFVSKEYKLFLSSIGYIVDEPEDFSISTRDVDKEIFQNPATQIVAPLSSPRYIVSAVNGRWSSLYRALYESDIIPEDVGLEKTESLNTRRMISVIESVREFLDRVLPFVDGGHKDVKRFWIEDEKLQIQLNTGKKTELIQYQSFKGYQGDPLKPTSILFSHHGLHIELIFDSTQEIGRIDPAGIQDVVLESATTVLLDSEDSVSTVDIDDKLVIYRHWLSLMQGHLDVIVEKENGAFCRRLSADRQFLSDRGSVFSLASRGVMMLRLVGLTQRTGYVCHEQDGPVADDIVDLLVMVASALHDLRLHGDLQNTHQNSIYLVKPKLSGPEEVKYVCDIFQRLEQLFQLPENTLKLGLIDEEPRTSLNLKACLSVAQERIFALCIGDLDRSAANISQSLEMGAMLPGSELLHSNWLKSCEKRAIEVALNAGFIEHAQIVHGMWIQPEQMKQMIHEQVHKSFDGATTTWVSSPNTSTLEIMTYHFFDVCKEQKLAKERGVVREVDDILVLPILRGNEKIQEHFLMDELDHHVLVVLSYLQSWISSGVGCMTVLDVDREKIIEDKALVRLSVQLMRNWLYHQICTKAQLEAAVVRTLNSHPNSWTSELTRQAFNELIFDEDEKNYCYIDSILYEKRQQLKSQSVEN